MGKRYSPSSLVAFGQCETRWLLERTKRMSDIGKAQTSSWVGHGISAGMEAWHKGELSGVPCVEAPQIAFQAAQDAQGRDLSLGMIIPMGMETEALLAPERAQRAVEFLMTKQPLRADFRTLAAELVFPEWGGARADLVVESMDGVTVVDYKSKVTCTSYMLDKVEAQYEYSVQLYLYAAALRSLGYEVTSAAIAMVVIEPKPKLHLWQYVIQPDLLLTYMKTWDRMFDRMHAVESGKEEPLVAMTHETPYGPCPWQAYCLQGWQAGVVERGDKA